MCTELPSVCTDPRKRTTALEVLCSGQELEPTMLLVGQRVCEGKVSLQCWEEGGRRELEGEGSPLLYCWE